MKKSILMKQKLTNLVSNMQGLLDNEETKDEELQVLENEINSLENRIKIQEDIEKREQMAAGNSFENNEDSESNKFTEISNPLTNKKDKSKEELLLEDAQNLQNVILGKPVVNAMESGDAAKGGVAVGTTLSKEIIREVQSRSQAYSFFDARVGSGNWNIVIVTADNAAEWVPEGTAPKASVDPTTSVITLKQHRLFKDIEVTQQLINGSSTEFINEIKNVVSDAIVDGIELGIFQGTGTDQPEGIITGLTAARKITLAARGKITIPELKKLKYKIKKRYWKISKFFMNQETFMEIDLLTDTTGKSLLQPDNSLETQYKLLGITCEETDGIPEFSATGANCIVVLASKNSYHTNTQKKIKFDIYNDSTYKRKGTVGLAADVYMDGKIKAINRVAGLMNPATT